MHRADPGSVDELQATGQELRRQLDAGRLDAQPIVGVPVLGGKAHQLRNGVFCLTSVAVAHDQPLAGSVPDDRDHRRERHDARREEVTTEQRVDQRALAALELTQHSQVEPRLRESRPARPQLVDDPRREQIASAADQLVDRSQHAPAGSDGRLGAISRHRYCLASSPLRWH
jgi:hypothetical protein